MSSLFGIRVIVAFGISKVSRTKNFCNSENFHMSSSCKFSVNCLIFARVHAIVFDAKVTTYIQAELVTRKLNIRFPKGFLLITIIFSAEFCASCPLNSVTKKSLKRDCTVSGSFSLSPQ